MIVRIAPFLLPTLLFESGLFMVLAPLPLFMLTLKNFPWVSALALFTNLAFLYALQGKASALIAAWLLTIVGILFPLLIKRFERIIPSFWFSFLFGLTLLYVTLVVVSLQENLGVVDYVKRQVSFNMEAVLQVPDSPLQKLVDEQGRAEVLREIVDELPAALIISYLTVFWLNLLFATRLMRDFITPQFWASYRNPEWLVWPTLLCGVSFVYGKFALYYIGLNGFKVMLALYALQGLSIISFLLNQAKIMGWGRGLIFVMSILIALPMVVAVGFFDQWFDFRRKFGQSL